VFTLLGRLKRSNFFDFYTLIYKNKEEKMKKLITTILLSISFIFAFTQDTVATNVYNSINRLRIEKGYKSLKTDKALELASAQHGCWLALYNNQTVDVELPTNEYRNNLSRPFSTKEDRILNYTDRKFSIAIEKSFVLYTEPSSIEIMNQMYKDVYAYNILYQGFDIIKYERNGQPIWYVVFLFTN